MNTPFFHSIRNRANHTKLISVLILLVLCSTATWAIVKLPRIFSNRMILQRDQPVLVWGFADPGEKVAVKTGGQTKQAWADEHGNWSVKLDPLKTGKPIQMKIMGKTNQLVINDILIGDVFLCSGQSNMAMSLDACKRFGSPTAVTDAQHTTLPMVRIFQTPNATFSAEPAPDVPGEWQSLKPEKNMGYSAIAFYFGKFLHEHLRIPVGIIRSSHGGGPIEAKMPLEALLSVNCGKQYYEENLKKSSPEMLEQLNREIRARWEKEAKDSVAAGKTPPPRPEPRKPIHGAYPAADWNGVIAPVIRYTKKAIVWYQGEHNTGRAYDYRYLFPVMIRSWREAGGDPDLPFLFVQLPAFGGAGDKESWPLLRESQWVTFQSTPNTAMVVTIDTGDKQNIHPPDKKTVAHRLFLEARHLIYGESVSGCGPLFDKTVMEGSKIIVNFKNVEGVLKFAKGKEGKGFTIAGDDRKFLPALAEIRGNSVEVSSPSLSRPVSVRYAWEGYPEVTLFDARNLPASPFRTDNWQSENY